MPHLPWHSTPSRCRSAGYTPSLAAPVPSPTFPTTLFSLRSTILLRFTAYHTRSPPRIPRRCSLLSSPSHTFCSSPSRAHHVGLSLPRSVAIPNLPILIYIRPIAYRHYDRHVAVRRIATLPGLERPSPLIRSRSPHPGRLDTSCSMVRDARSIRASHEIPTNLRG